jgi:4-hydroxybenzoate polyprenyltransferase
MTKQKLTAYIQLARADRPIGTFLLLWPTLWALWLAGSGQPDADIVIIMVAGTFVMRAAGCVVNDYADRNLDPHVERTLSRPLAAGTLSTTEALGLFILLLAIALVLVLQLNKLAIYTSFFALGIALIYPFTKRFTDLPQCVLGIAFSMGIPMAYAALTNSIPMEAWLLFAANFCWIVAYDTYYAMADRDDDTFIGVKSTAILFGKADRLIIGLLQLVALIVLAYIGSQRSLNWHYFLGLVGAACFAVYQQVITHDRDPQRCFQAFLNNNWFGAVIYCGLVLSLMDN